MSQIVQENLMVNAEVQSSILLVLSNEELRDDILDILGVSYRVRLAQNATFAKEVLTEYRPNLVAIDDSLSMSEVCKLSIWIKSNVLLDHIPVLVLSTNTSEEAKLDAASAQIDAFLASDTHNLTLFYLVLRNLLEAVEKQRLWYSKNYLKETRQLKAGRKDEAFLVGLNRIVNSNIQNAALDINFVCREMGISRTNLYSKVKTVTGMGMAVFIRENRLNLAAKLLMEQDMYTNEVMSMVGIQSHSYFSKAFKKKFGVSPSSFGNHK